MLGRGELQLPEGGLTQVFCVQEFMSDTRAGRCPYRDVPSNTGLGGWGPINSLPTPWTQPCARRRKGLHTGQVEA